MQKKNASVVDQGESTASASALPEPLVSCSVVSHGQGQLIRKLLTDMRGWKSARLQIIVTLNIHEDEHFLAEFADLDILVLRNHNPKGFGSNHNQAHRSAEGEFFLVVNPDISTGAFDLQPLIDTARRPRSGVTAPMVVSPAGEVEDSARPFPTLAGLFRRVMLRKIETFAIDPAKPTTVDWVGGMFMLFRTDFYAQLGGFDERYFMYFEDVDLCHRISQRQQDAIVDPRVRVVHDARRASRTDMKHFRWHFRSAVRYLIGI